MMNILHEDVMSPRAIFACMGTDLFWVLSAVAGTMSATAVND